MTGGGIPFLLNDEEVEADAASGSVLLDYIRYRARLPGTKIGCREGDCGACTVLVGELEDAGHVTYRTTTSCLMPLGNAAGRHIVTIEGLDLGAPNAIQEAFVTEGATQCGFCTPGFIVSLAGHCISPADPIAAISGNICRCTGYHSIRRAIDRVRAHVDRHDGDLVSARVLPEWFATIPARLRALPRPSEKGTGIAVGGGTDLWVQRPEAMADTPDLRLHFWRRGRRAVQRDGDRVVLGGSVTMEDLNRSPDMHALFPRLEQHLRLIGSQPIRNMATLAGNIANASPIGDMTIFLLALDSTLRLSDEATGTRRDVALRAFFRSYKDTELRPGEEIESISFEAPSTATCFNFEKVSKRTHLDIASVNAAASFRVDDGNRITAAHCAVGGVAPIPLYLAETSAFLVGKPLETATVRDAARIADGEIAPIDDVRGSAAYKRMLVRQLLFAHFVVHAADRVAPKELLA